MSKMHTFPSIPVTTTLVQAYVISASSFFTVSLSHNAPFKFIQRVLHPSTLFEYLHISFQFLYLNFPSRSCPVLYLAIFSSLFSCLWHALYQPNIPFYSAGPIVESYSTPFLALSLLGIASQIFSAVQLHFPLNLQSQFASLGIDAVLTAPARAEADIRHLYLAACIWVSCSEDPVSPLDGDKLVQ